MTCGAKWAEIRPGAIVYFPGQSKLTVIKLKDQWGQYECINGHCCVELGSGRVLHVGELFIFNDPYTGQFIWNA